MKKYILGVISVIFLQGILDYTWLYSIDNDKDSLSKISRQTLAVLKLEPLTHVFTGRCKDYTWERSNGTKVNNRQWFGCNKFQILLSDLIYEKETGN